MKRFEITLKNEKAKFYQRLSWFIIIINTVLLLYLAFFAADNAESKRGIVFLILLSICFSLYFYFRNTKYQIGFHLFFFLIVLVWISMEKYWFAGINLLFDILGTIATRKFIVAFSQSKVVYPSLPMKNIAWAELNNVVLKDGLLTIDFKSNKLIQQKIDEEKTNVDEQEFNDFCRQHLNQ